MLSQKQNFKAPAFAHRSSLQIHPNLSVPVIIIQLRFSRETNVFGILKERDGPHQADSQEVHRGEGSEKAVGHQGCSEVCTGHRRSEETPQIQAGNSGAEGDQEVPEEHGAFDQKVAVPEAGEGDRSGLQDGFEVPEQRSECTPGGGGGVPGWSL